MGVSSFVGFGGAEVAPKWPQVAPKGHQVAPKGRQVAPKGRPRGAYVAPKWSPSGAQVPTPECPETQVFLPTPTTGRPTPKGGPGSLTPQPNLNRLGDKFGTPKLEVPPSNISTG